MTDKFKDFDEAIREVNDAKITFKVAGQTFDCPAQLPAKVVLTQLKMQNELGGIDQKDIGEWLRMIIGEETFDKLLEQNISWTILEELLSWLLVQYGIVQSAEELEGSDFQRFFNLQPLELSWRRFKNLIFSLVSQESSFYAPYLTEYMEQSREEIDSENSLNKENRVKINLDTALDELGGAKESVSFNE